MYNMMVSRINHLPPACLSTFWKSTFKQHLGCRFDKMKRKSSFLFRILTYAIVYFLINHMVFGCIFISYRVFSIFIKYSCTNGLHRRCLHTFYDIPAKYIGYFRRVQFDADSKLDLSDIKPCQTNTGIPIKKHNANRTKAQ